MAEKSVSASDICGPSPSARSGVFAAFLCGLLALSGCEPAAQLQRELGAVRALLTGGHSPLAGKNARAPEPEYEMGEAARRSQANGELLSEMVQVALLKEPKGAVYTGYVAVMNQGASLEGLYNGFMHSSELRRQEMAGGPAAPDTLRRFAELLAGIESELPEPTAFDASSAKPLQVLEPNRLSKPEATAVTKTTAANKPVPEAYLRTFDGASFFTLKRVLGDEALKLIAAKAGDRESLARWYGRWAVVLTRAQVDFGLALRNKADEAFHEQWARQAGEDQLRWEVLNRLHRILNAAERRVPSRAAPTDRTAASRAN